MGVNPRQLNINKAPNWKVNAVVLSAMAGAIFLGTYLESIFDSLLYIFRVIWRKYNLKRAIESLKLTAV